MALSADSNALSDMSAIKDMAPAHIAMVYTEWNEKIVAAQLKGAKKIAQATGHPIVWEVIVPGCFELPYACRSVIAHHKKHNNPLDAVIAFGAVIRGGTPHFDYVCKAVTEGILQLNVAEDVPVIFGILTLDNEDQAWERLGGAHGHKGEEAMIAALKMAQLKRTLS